MGSVGHKRQRNEKPRAEHRSGKGLFSVLALSLSVGLLPLLSGCDSEPESVVDVPDTEISEAIQREFIQDQVVLASQVEIETEGGIVTLQGSVDHLQQKRWAKRISETVKGVRSVVNLLTVDPSGTFADDELEREVQDALYRDPATDSWEISTAVSDGTVVLSGTVDSWTERDLAETVASGVEGIRAIENEIEVVSPESRDDLEIEREIEEALKWDALVDHALIDVGVLDGFVALSGFVGSAAEKRQARRDALVPAIQGVDDSRLAVVGWARDEDFRGEKYLPAPDEEIESALSQAFSRHPRLESTSASASVHESVAVLEGSVGSVKAIRDAINIAHNTVGVQQVENQLTVVADIPRTDADIAHGIETALAESAFLDEELVAVRVDDGLVTLDGTVASDFQRLHADELASRVQGVIDVANRLMVDAAEDLFLIDPYVWEFDPTPLSVYELDPMTTDVADQVIGAAVEEEFYWSPFVNEDEIQVTVEEGVVILEGSVGSATEKRLAILNAYEGGAAWVDDQLEVVQTSPTQ
jgi:osmotically-inducible protein OsmY